LGQLRKIALITGITGQDGAYLSELLLSKGYKVHGIKRRASSLNTQRVDKFYDHPDFHLHYGDVTDSANMMQLINQIRPDEIYNLAAQSHVAVSFEMPLYTVNVDGTAILGILEAVRLLGLDCKIYQAGTSEMFGNALAPQSEVTPFQPCSPYACAKVMAHHLMVTYRQAYNMHCVNGILFNHESPLRGETFVTRKIVDAAKAIYKGKQNILKLGNLNATRDWGHAKDYVRGMWLMMQHPTPEDWILATGQVCTVREFTTKVFAKLGVKIHWTGTGLYEVGMDNSGRILVRVDERYYRPNEVEYLQGDSIKAYDKLGWAPDFTLDDLINDMMDA
jgi:GDPmannose 4,6-dehydratase